MCLVSSQGCVQRRLTIRTNPPGAVVYIDNYEIGTTPVATDYVYYGTRKITIVKDGYETLTTYEKISPPWYEWFPLDAISENVIPWEIRDERALQFNLAPQVIVPTEQLTARANAARERNRAQAGLPPPAGPASLPRTGTLRGQQELPPLGNELSPGPDESSFGEP